MFYNSCVVRREKQITILGFLLPAAALYGVFFLWPMAQAFYISLFRWRGVSANREWVGLANFRTLLGDDPIFWSSLWHNAVFLAASLVIVIPAAMFFAVALSGRVRGAGTFRAIFLFPNMISVAAVAVLWAFVYHPTFGLLNSLVKSVGLQRWAVGWLGEPSTALYAVIAASIWYTLGFYIVLLLAGVQNIPRTFYEAAWIDGAGGWQSFRHITIPLVWEILKLGIIYLVIHTLNVFGLVWVMTEGGPSNHTDTLLTYLYRQAFINSNFGYATAIAVVVFVVILAVSLVLIRLMRREVVEY